MRWKRKLGGGVLVTIGFLLSPLSWWNDLFINIPLALGFAWIISAFYRPAFEASLILGYLLTNALGLFLMQKGFQKVASDKHKPYTRSNLMKDIAISLAYTALMILLLKLKWIAPLKEYFAGGTSSTSP